MRFKMIFGVLALGVAFSIRAQTVTNIFTFTGHETYPVDEGISLLHAADLTGDGLNDLIVANNQRSKIDLLYNETGKTNPPAAPAGMELNELPPGCGSTLIPSPRMSGSPRCP